MIKRTPWLIFLLLVVIGCSTTVVFVKGESHDVEIKNDPSQTSQTGIQFRRDSIRTRKTDTL